MIPYITYREINDTGVLCYYILQKVFPNYVGIVSVGKLDNAIASEPIAGYHLYVNFHGTINGRMIPNFKDVLQDIQTCLMSMDNWFLENRIKTEPKKYAKFKIQ